MKRRSFLGNLVASAIALVAAPKVVKAEDKKDLWKQYPLTYKEAFKKGQSADVLGKNGWEPSSECIIEDGYVALYTSGIVRQGDVLATDVFGEKLYVKEIMGDSMTDIGFITKYRLTPLRDNKVCGKSVIKMANNKLRLLLRKENWPMKCRYMVVFTTFREVSN